MPFQPNAFVPSPRVIQFKLLSSCDTAAKLAPSVTLEEYQNKSGLRFNLDVYVRQDPVYGLEHDHPSAPEQPLKDLGEIVSSLTFSIGGSLLALLHFNSPALAIHPKDSFYQKEDILPVLKNLLGKNLNAGLAEIFSSHHKETFNVFFNSLIGLDTFLFNQILKTLQSVINSDDSSLKEILNDLEITPLIEASKKGESNSHELLKTFGDAGSIKAKNYLEKLSREGTRELTLAEKLKLRLQQLESGLSDDDNENNDSDW